MNTRKPLVAFIHVEKAAGTTFIHILRHNFFPGYADVRPFFQESNGLFTGKDLRLMRRVLPGLRCIGGHAVVPYSDLFVNEPDARLITILRDPVKRYMSQYQHWVEKKRIDISFEEFMGREEFWNFQTRKYAGEVDLGKAKEVLRSRFMLVGCVEKYDEFLVLLQHKLNDIGFDASYRPQNRAHNKIKVDDTLQRYREDIEARNSVDIALHKYVIDELFPSYVEAYGASFQEDVNAFKLRNETIGPPMLKRYLDYGIRKFYVEPVTGILRCLHGKPYRGSY